MGVAITSKEAYAASCASGVIAETREKILKHLAIHGPDHDTHGADATGVWLNTYAPTRTGLKKDGLVRRSGERATNKRGNSCIVWELTDEGREAVSAWV